MRAKVQIVDSVSPLEFKDRHKGERVWIIGNGPSARNWTMEELRELGGCVMGVNASWKPSPDGTYAGFQDTEYHSYVSGTHGYDVCKGSVRTGTVFMPRTSAWIVSDAKCKVDSDFCLVGIMNSGYQPQRFRYDIDKGVMTKFAGYFAVQVCAWMGFDQFMLVGFSAGDYEAHACDDEPYKGRVTREGMRRWFQGVGHWALETKGKRIINCDPTSKIPYFDKLDKDEVRAACA